MTQLGSNERVRYTVAVLGVAKDAQRRGRDLITHMHQLKGYRPQANVETSRDVSVVGASHRSEKPSEPGG